MLNLGGQISFFSVLQIQRWESTNSNTLNTMALLKAGKYKFLNNFTLI